MAILRGAWWWQPASYVQAWLIAAAAGLVGFAVASAIGGPIGVHVLSAAGVMLGVGVGQSYHMGHRN